MLTDEVSQFAHFFSSASVLPQFHELHLHNGSEPSIHTESVNAIRDSSGRCWKVDVSCDLDDLHSCVEAHAMGTALIGGEEFSDNQVHFRVLYLPNCSVEECLREVLFTYTENEMTKFIS